MVGFVQKSFDNVLSMSSFSSQLCSWCVCFAIIINFLSFVMFKDVFSKVPDGAFVWCLLHGVPSIFLEVVWCRVCVFVWCCNYNEIVLYYKCLLVHLI